MEQKLLSVEITLRVIQPHGIPSLPYPTSHPLLILPGVASK